MKRGTRFADIASAARVMKHTPGLVLGGSLLIVGCSTSPAESAAQVAAKVSGLVCSPAPPSETAVEGIKPGSQLDCTLGAQSVTIVQDADAAQVDAAEAAARAKIGCPPFKAHGIMSVSAVFGKYWVVSTPSKAVALQIQHAEGGRTKLLTINC